MQKNQISDSTAKDLQQWLSNPGTGAEPGKTQQDLQWLEKTKDLSSIELGDEETAPSIRKEKPPSESGAPGGKGGTGASGFMALFTSCAGKRK